MNRVCHPISSWSIWITPSLADTHLLLLKDFLLTSNLCMRNVCDVSTRSSRLTYCRYSITKSWICCCVVCLRLILKTGKLTRNILANMPDLRPGIEWLSGSGRYGSLNSWPTLFFSSQASTHWVSHGSTQSDDPDGLNIHNRFRATDLK